MEYTMNMTGYSSLPPDRTCVALCGRQLNAPNYQLHQYILAGFMQEHQFIGHDRDPEIVAQNQLQHPGARYRCGEQIKLMPSSMQHRPMLIDLDTTSVASTSEAYAMVAQSLLLAEPDTVVAYNVALRNWRRPSSPLVTLDEVMSGIATLIPQRILAGWNHHPLSPSTFGAKTRRADMQTFLFYLPKQEMRLAA